MYPCLGKHDKNGNIILFNAKQQGTIIASEDQDKIGNKSLQLVMKNYTPLPNGATITITQKLP